jgi:endonuclease/exonuclease/phosphatase family metal-dependent hydrolase
MVAKLGATGGAVIMRVASFNVENLFSRPKVFGLGSWSEGRPILDAYNRVTDLLERETYTDATKHRIIELLTELGLESSDTGHGLVLLRQNRGRLVRRPAAGVEIVADGRGDWIGWLELKREAVDEEAIRNTARVIANVNADIIGVVEADDRPSLVRFNDDVLKPTTNRQYESIMLIDGNDKRGIDVALMTKKGYPITQMRSHVDATYTKGKIFGRDCPEYLIERPGQPEILVMVNHLKSKGYGGYRESNNRRRRQAEEVQKIYEQPRAEGFDNIIVMGDFNDTPDSTPLRPLLHFSDLQDVSESPQYVDDGWPGTYKGGTASTKIDYILLSPALFGFVTEAYVYRKGVWGNKAGDRWELLPTVTREKEAASDHAAVAVEIAI